ncbi:chondroitinase-B domain-containing protein [Flavicella marina]|uniref:chondroitinase-B domain-containing protein n=1 Tax=Flavicella marina TaxID=1475951 RepID=UPI001D00AB4E|nr:chondroitinase-B domain-containing protein [Flavicella marina]
MKTSIMTKHSFYFIAFLLIISCKTQNSTDTVIVSNSNELKTAISDSKPGSIIVMKNGVWKNTQIVFNQKGTEEQPITLQAETPGGVLLEGQSDLKIAGEYLIVKGLTFQNGYTPSNSVIDFKVSKTEIANHCTVTECVIKNYNQLHRNTQDHWVEFWGRHNTLSHTYLGGKFNQGPTIIVGLSGNEHIKNYHQIVYNHFGPKPRKGGPKAECIRIGNSFTSMTPSHVNVSHNLFEKCNGEVEIISSKSNFNEFNNNIFYECEGSLVVRHGNYCKIDGNFFIGNNKPFVGGIRVINTGHTVTNNYFYKIIGDEFRSALAIMNGIPKSPLNRYNQVTDVVVAHNTWVDCSAPWQFSVGANSNKKDILPKQEIRSARPIRTLLANNIIYNTNPELGAIKNYDKVDGVIFKNNIINQNIQNEDYKSFLQKDALNFKQDSDILYTPSNDDIALLQQTYPGFEFDKITTDIFGNSRKDKNLIGAISSTEASKLPVLNYSKYGPKWYENETSIEANNSIKVSNSEELIAAINSAKSNSTIVLNKGIYTLNSPLIIKNELKLTAANKNTTISFSGAKNEALFELFPYANLELNNIILKGEKSLNAFAPNDKDLSGGFNLNVKDCTISNFHSIIKSCKGAFSDQLIFENTSFENCINGIELNSEIDDKGDYNAEFLTIDNCQFKNISKNIVDYYRGGYDESTIGGNLEISNTTFERCGSKEKSGILIKTRGIVNVNIHNNTFKNNPVSLVALLWGEKQNLFTDNSLKNSGKIKTEKYLKQKLVY